MTDEELSISDATLIARLREDVFYGDERLHNLSRHNPLHMEAADRIELLATTNEQLVATNGAMSISNATLIAERDEAVNQLDSARHSVDVLEKRCRTLIAERDALFRRATLAEEWRDHDKTRAEAAEARLGKAVEALERIEGQAFRKARATARTTLAEIKSHSDEFATQKGESHE